MTALDLAKIAAHITLLTGHKAGTWEHERMTQRVATELFALGVSSIRDDARLRTYLLDREEFERAEVTA